MSETQFPAQTVTPLLFRRVLAGVPTGIAVVAAEIDGVMTGISANSFTSVSLDPPLVSVSFAHTSTSWPVLRRARRWGISILGEDAHHVLTSLRRPTAERFVDIDTETSPEGAVFVRGALATLNVELDTEVDAGDHVLTLLRVLDLTRDEEQLPLVFFGGGAHRLSP
jgi:flavin reductase (DIM6/NTAB) family NADH-FMN oxidoreductase RutF